MTPFNSKYKVTQAFGVNADYYKQFGLKAHEGLDLIPTGSVWDVFSVCDGIVVNETDNPRSGAYGIWLTIWNPAERIALQYCHLKENYVSAGDKVTKGQKIGIMGSTGNSTGPHLHLNMFNVDEQGIRLNRDNGYNGGIDPLPYLEREETTQPNTQAIIDELREARDKNWRLYEASQKDNDTLRLQLQELNSSYEGVNQELLSYKGIIKVCTELLNLKPTETEKMSGEIKRLIEIEDQLHEATRKAESMAITIDEQEIEILALQNNLRIVTQERNDSRTALDTCVREKQYKSLHEYPWIVRLLSLLRR